MMRNNTIVDDDYINLKPWTSIDELEMLITDILNKNNYELSYLDVYNCSCYMIEYYIETNPMIISRMRTLGVSEASFKVDENKLGIESICFCLSYEDELDAIDEILLNGNKLYNVVIYLNFDAFQLMLSSPPVFSLHYHYILKSGNKDIDNNFKHLLKLPKIDLSLLYNQHMNKSIRVSLFQYLFEHNHINLCIDDISYSTFLIDIINIETNLKPFDLTYRLFSLIFLDSIEPYIVLENYLKISKDSRPGYIKTLILEIDYVDFYDYCNFVNISLEDLLKKYKDNDIVLRLVHVPDNSFVDDLESLENMELVRCGI